MQSGNSDRVATSDNKTMKIEEIKHVESIVLDESDDQIEVEEEVPELPIGKSPSETPIETPAEAPIDTPLDIQVEIPVEIIADAPAEEIIEIPKDVPVQDPKPEDKADSTTNEEKKERIIEQQPEIPLDTTPVNEVKEVKEGGNEANGLKEDSHASSDLGFPGFEDGSDEGGDI